MRITSLIDDCSANGLTAEHGLSLYISLQNGKHILFDMGQTALFAQHAKQLHLSLQAVDWAVISHGHYDHGGGLHTFLAENDHAPVYIQPNAFEPHYSLHEDGIHHIGLDADLRQHPRLIWAETTTTISEECMLFANVQGTCCYPMGNQHLTGANPPYCDTFDHEQNMLIKEGEQWFLFAGCAHRGIINIIQRATELCGQVPQHVFGGMHLVSHDEKDIERTHFIKQLGNELAALPCSYHTMHCTGKEAFEQLRQCLGKQIDYLSCGQTMWIE